MKNKNSMSVAIPEGAGIALQRLGISCDRHPDKCFFVSDNEEMNYREAYEASLLLISYLKNGLELQSGMVVFASVPNTAHFIILLIAAESLGLHLALRSPGLRQNQLDTDFRALRPEVAIVSSDDDLAKVKEAAPNIRAIGIGDNIHDTKRIDLEPKVSPRLTPVEHLKDAYRDARVILSSSGSSGEPKAIVNDASSFVFNASRLSATFELSSEDTLFLPVPFFHVYGIVGIFAALVSGASIATLLKYEARCSMELIPRVGATVYFGVPTMFLRELAELKTPSEEGWQLRAGMIAGANCPSAAIAEYEERFGCTLVQSYGMTETAATLTAGKLSDVLEDRAADVGYPIDGVVMAVDSDSGELLVKTPALMKGVYSAKGVEPPKTDANGWLHTGDIGMVTEKGTIDVFGRMDDVIIRGGINIIPEAVEQVYRSHEDISECYVVGYSDYELGQRTCLCVLPRREISQLQSLRDFATGRLDKCEYPDCIVQVDSFPHLQNGKIDRKSLALQIADQMNLK